LVGCQSIDRPLTPNFLLREIPNLIARRSDLSAIRRRRWLLQKLMANPSQT